MSNQSVRDLLDESGVLNRVLDGDLVVIYESELEDADGVVNMENVDGGRRGMVVRQVLDLDFVPNSEWVCFCMTAETWSLARGRDTIMWNSTFGDSNASN
jgi:hypothetical protein